MLWQVEPVITLTVQCVWHQWVGIVLSVLRHCAIIYYVYSFILQICEYLPEMLFKTLQELLDDLSFWDGSHSANKTFISPGKAQDFTKNSHTLLCRETCGASMTSISCVLELFITICQDKEEQRCHHDVPQQRQQWHWWYVFLQFALHLHCTLTKTLKLAELSGFLCFISNFASWQIERKERNKQEQMRFLQSHDRDH